MCRHIGRLLGDRSIHGAFLDGLQRILNTIEANHDHILAGLIAQGLNGAQGHLIVFCENGLDVRVCLQQVRGHVQALDPFELGGLLGNNLDIGAVFQTFVEALAPFPGG